MQLYLIPAYIAGDNIAKLIPYEEKRKIKKWEEFLIASANRMSYVCVQAELLNTGTYLMIFETVDTVTGKIFA